MATWNFTSYSLPPLPEYTLRPLPPVISWMPDAYLALALPVIGYWITSGIFHIIDVYDLFPQYRLHTPAEVLKRNHVTRWECLRQVLVQQIIQTVFGLVISTLDEQATSGKDDYNVAWYAQQFRLAQRGIPAILATVGLKPYVLASKVAHSQPMLAEALSGGRYSNVVQTITVAGTELLVPGFAPWELAMAKFVYWLAIPALQFSLGFIAVDTWEYFLHRAMHMNKWLYTTFHSHHHRLYVPYAYGALYNHWVEALVLDTLGTGLAYLIAGMTVRQSMWFFTLCTIKTVDDHCGYSLPWDPLQRITSNNAGYHDIHHQSWGIKTNFSQPFFTFWDSYLGTAWNGDVSARYERGRVAAQRKLEQEQDNGTAAATVDKTTLASTSGIDQVVNPQQSSAPRSTRKKASSISQSPSDNLKGLRNKVNGSLHGKGGNVLRAESSR